MDLCDGDFDPNLCFNGSLDLDRLDDSLSLTGSLDHLSKGSLWLWLGSLDLDLLDLSLDLDLRNIGSLDLDRSDLEDSL
jgi:hypothetical protein